MTSATILSPACSVDACGILTDIRIDFDLDLDGEDDSCFSFFGFSGVGERFRDGDRGGGDGSRSGRFGLLFERSRSGSLRSSLGLSRTSVPRLCGGG